MVDLQVELHVFVDLHNRGLVAASVAVVGCREDCDDVAVMRPVVTIHYQLMGTGNQFQVI